MPVYTKNHELFKSDYFVSSKELQAKRVEVAEKLNIVLEEPKQEKRIEALFKLLKSYLYKSDTKAYLLQKIIESAEKLTSIYLQQVKEIDSIVLSNYPGGLKEEQLNHLHYKNIQAISSLEEKILFYKELIFAYENKEGDLKNISEKHFEELKEIDDKCFDYWRKTIEINYELRNTIIGFNNRLALFKAGNAYVNYHIFVEKRTEETFEKIKTLKHDGIKQYYDMLNQYSLPADKSLNFQLFIQKKIESKLHDSMELKMPLGNQLDFDYAQIEANVELINKQYKTKQEEIIAVINFYKDSLIRKQTIFTDDANELVGYLKDRYVEKINQIFQQVSDYKKIHKQERTELLEDEDKALLIHLAQEEFEVSLNAIKDRYSKQFVPMLDSFDKILTSTENKFSFSHEELERKSMELISLKKLNVEYLIEKFENERNKIKENLQRKEFLINDAIKLTVYEAEKLVDKLRRNCESICHDILGFNQKFWTKSYVEFDVEARKVLLKLHCEYAPWVHVWNEGNKPWFQDYLIMNLNQEYMHAIGESLKDFSPESDLFLESSNALLQLNEFLREIYKNRDEIEYEHLLKLNTIPEVDLIKLQNICDDKLNELKESNHHYLGKYNNVFGELINSRK